MTMSMPNCFPKPKVYASGFNGVASNAGEPNGLGFGLGCFGLPKKCVSWDLFTEKNENPTTDY